MLNQTSISLKYCSVRIFGCLFSSLCKGNISVSVLDMRGDRISEDSLNQREIKAIWLASYLETLISALHFRYNCNICHGKLLGKDKLHSFLTTTKCIYLLSAAKITPVHGLQNILSSFNLPSSAGAFPLPHRLCSWAFCSTDPFPLPCVSSSSRSLAVALRCNLRVSQEDLLCGFLQGICKGWEDW